MIEYRKTNRTKDYSWRLSRIFVILVLSLFYSSSFAQKMSIASFKLDEADQTANVSPTMKTDMNGEKCALIKIATTQKNFSFDVGSLGITSIDWQDAEHPGEIWLYIPAGVMKITIQHPQFGSIKDYDLGGRLKKGRTYVMDLTSDQVNTLVVDYDNSQYLDIDVNPKNAEFFINGIKQKLDANGRASISLPFGTHNYRVTAQNYHPEESQIIINNKENKHSLNVRLKQAFGYLNVSSTPDSKGAELYIDDEKVGTLPISDFPLNSGQHKVTVSHKLYLPFTENVTMSDSATVSISPILKPNYSEYEIIVDGDNDAQIFDDGDFLGTGRWKGRLSVGEHIITASKEGHKSISQKVKVEKNTPEVLTLVKPVPKFGVLDVQTTPSNAMIYVDNKFWGTTPFTSNQILEGKHHIKLQLKGHKVEECEVDIIEGQTEKISRDLTDYCDFNISSTPMADLSIDDEYIGTTPRRVNLVAGDYTVKLTAEGYSSFSKKMHLDSKSHDMTIKLHRNYIRPHEFYAHFGFEMGSDMAFNFGMGGHIYNFNIEANFLWWGEISDKIGWGGMWNDEPFTINSYSPWMGSFKLGYGFRVSNRIRFSPQIGGQYIRLIETPDISGGKMANNSNALSLSLGLRCYFACTQKFGISITPQYIKNLRKSEGFKVLSEVSSKINGYANGFNCCISINYTL